MPKLTAKTSNGTEISRNSKINYTHAYAVTVEAGRVIRQGFSRSITDAMKAANSELGSIRNKGYGEHVDGKFIPYNLNVLDVEVMPVTNRP